MIATESTPMTFRQIRRQAEAEGYRMKLLARVLAVENPFAMTGEDYHPRASELSAAMSGICVVLDLIASAPNAHINREGLDAMQEQVECARNLSSEAWVQELLSEACEILGNPDDLIVPF